MLPSFERNDLIEGWQDNAWSNEVLWAIESLHILPYTCILLHDNRPSYWFSLRNLWLKYSHVRWHHLLRVPKDELHDSYQLMKPYRKDIWMKSKRLGCCIIVIILDYISTRINESYMLGLAYYKMDHMWCFHIACKMHIIDLHNKYIIDYITRSNIIDFLGFCIFFHSSSPYSIKLFFLMVNNYPVNVKKKGRVGWDRESFFSIPYLTITLFLLLSPSPIDGHYFQWSEYIFCQNIDDLWTYYILIKHWNQA